MNNAAHAIFQKGHVPVVGVNMVLPILDTVGHDRYEELMMPVSLALAARCDAGLRVGGESAGADEEMKTIRARGGRIYTSVAEIPTESGEKK